MQLSFKLIRMMHANRTCYMGIKIGCQARRIEKEIHTAVVMDNGVRKQHG
ncbi:Uncharacterised protein [Vibrio cholerae]|uniref:Uncharacterized protein n=1 Tax=Vibrio cholerae TaxID=666 RepID=A0A655ZK28_VIBCL|nr:Uncharacterised protein [Vibrio cholerae]CSA80588.1 Uncharacterised protein [Vibrio cholerae]CSA82402.1 Uncharacterised protein [Vibrio cholerae]CSA84373.1 Uncharacterised protein [Vibrio cholerae]CSA92717.1 Uncharacterised protein [Vibrio cholerae]